MKVEKLKICWNKMGLMGCRWSSLNAPGTGNPLFHSVLKLEEFPFPIIGLWGNGNWPPSMKVKKLGKFQNERGAKGCKWSWMNAPGTQTPLSHSVLKLEEFPFPINWPSGVIRNDSPVWKNKSGKLWTQKWLNGLQMVQFECPRYWKPSVSFSFEVGRISFSHYWPRG